MYTPEIITELETGGIFVFGSNDLGRHAGGAAAVAVDKFDAIEGIPIGLQGNSYGIITTSFTGQNISIGFIREQVDVLYQFAKIRTDLTFYVTKIGCGIAGWSVPIIADVFIGREYCRPANIILPKEFTNQK